MRRASVWLAVLALASPVAAQTVPTPAADAAAATAGLVGVTLTTDFGPVVIAVDAGHAPVTAANFLRYVDRRRLDGISFYRSVRVQPDFGFVQFGTANDPARTLPPIAHEPTTKTGLAHVSGAISMAMATPGTAGGDFFVMVGDTPSMDATATAPGYAVFGRVVAGMDVIRRILAAPTSPTKGVGLMKGQMLEPALLIAAARRTPLPPGIADPVARRAPAAP